MYFRASWKGNLYDGIDIVFMIHSLENITIAYRIFHFLPSFIFRTLLRTKYDTIIHVIECAVTQPHCGFYIISLKSVIFFSILFSREGKRKSANKCIRRTMKKRYINLLQFKLPDVWNEMVHMNWINWRRDFNKTLRNFTSAKYLIPKLQIIRHNFQLALDLERIFELNEKLITIPLSRVAGYRHTRIKILRYVRAYGNNSANNAFH